MKAGSEPHKRLTDDPLGSNLSFQSAIGISSTPYIGGKRTRKSPAESIPSPPPASTPIPSVSMPAVPFYEARQGDADIFHMEMKLPSKEVPCVNYTRVGKKIIGWSNDVQIRFNHDGSFEEVTSKDYSLRYFEKEFVSVNGESDDISFQTSCVTDIGCNDFIALEDLENEALKTSDLIQVNQPIQVHLSKPRYQAPSNLNDVSGWLAFIDAQENSPYAPSVIQERQVAILQRALQANPNSLPLVWRYLEITSQKMMVSEVLPLWVLTRNHFKSMLEVQERFLVEFRSIYEFFSVSNYIYFVVKALGPFQNQPVALGEQVFIDRIIMETLQLLTLSGHLQGALGCILGSREGDFLKFLQAHISSPQSLHSNILLDETTAFLDPEEEFIFGDLETMCHNFLYERKDILLCSVFAILDAGGIYMGRDLQIDYLPYALMHVPHGDLIYSWEDNWIVSKDYYSVKPNLFINPSPMLQLGTAIDLLQLMTRRLPNQKVLLTKCSQLQELCYQRGESSQDGSEYCKQLLAKQPENIDLWLDYVMLLRWKGSDEDALKVVMKLLKYPKIEGQFKVQLLLIYGQITSRLGFTKADGINFIIKSMGIEGNGPTALLKLKHRLNELAIYQPLQHFLNNQVDFNGADHPAPFDPAVQVAFLRGQSGRVIQETILPYLKLMTLQSTLQLSSLFQHLIRSAPYAKHTIFQALKNCIHSDFEKDQQIQSILTILEDKGCFINYFW